MEKKRTSKPIITGAIIVLVVVGLLAIAYFFVLPMLSLGPKNITIKVTSSSGASTEYRLRTKAKNLLQAMDELVAGDSGFTYTASDDGSGGIVVESINSERALFTEDNAYWAIYVNGEFGSHSSDEQPIDNEYVYEWRYELLY